MSFDANLLVAITDYEPNGSPTHLSAISSELGARCFRNQKETLDEEEGRFLAVLATTLDEVDEASPEWRHLIDLVPGRRRVEAGFYRHVRSQSRSDSRSEIDPTAVLLVFSFCSPPEKEPDFNSWYKSHVEKVIATTPFSTIRLYRRAFPGTEGAPRYLALWETDWDDIARLERFMERLDEMRRQNSLPDPAPPFVQFFGRSLFVRVKTK